MSPPAAEGPPHVSSSVRGDPWDAHASWWQAEFTEGADPEYVEQILPLIEERLPRRGVLVDAGCGEGQVARLGASVGLDVLGVDPAPAQIRAAQERGGGPVYALGSATDLPVRSASVDAAVACLVFEHIDDHVAALTEVARVLRPGGSFLFLLNHPLLQTPGSGWIDDHMVDPPEQYWRLGEYLVETATYEEVERGVHIRFVHRPLSSYLNAAIRAGLRLEEMLEPAPPVGFLAAAPEYEAASTIPRLLLLRFTRSSRVAGGGET